MVFTARVRRLAAAAVVALVFGAIVSAPAPASQAAAPKVLNIAAIDGIDSLNPFLAYFLDATDLMSYIYPSLMTSSAKDQKPLPDMAKSLKPSKDKLTWTFTIRKGLKWSDGKPLTAKDAAFTLNLMRTDDAAATANGNSVKEFTSVKATDPHTLVIKTKTPQITVQTLTVPIVPEHIWSKVGDVGKYKNDDFPVVGAGPFVLTDYKADQYVKLKANKDFWRGRPKVDQLVFRTYKNTDAAVEALRKGEVDLVTKLNPNQYDALKGEKGITRNSADAARFFELGLNPGSASRDGKLFGDGHPALRDKRVRQALAHAIDKKLIIKKVLRGHGTAAEGLLPTAMGDWHWSPAQGKASGFDLKKANAILDDAGYKRGSDGIRRMPNGSRPLKFRLLGHSELPEDRQIASYMKSWYKDLGISLDTQIVSKTRLNDLLGKGQYDIALGGWSSGPDPDFIMSIQTCAQRPLANGTGGNTDNFNCVKGYDALYHKQSSTFDHAARVDVVHRMQAQLYDYSANIMVYYPKQLEAYRSDRFTHLTRQPARNGVIMHQSGYWSYLDATPVAADDDSGVGAGAVVAVVVVVIVLIAGAAFLVVRRRRVTAQDRE